MTTFLSSLSSEDRRKFYLSCLGFMCAASAALIARTVGDTLFLSRHDMDSLSFMYMGTAVIVGGAAYTFGVLTARISLSKLIMMISLFLTLFVFVLWFLLFYQWKILGIAAYFMGDLIANIPMLLFWSFVTLLFNPREAKRLFGYIGASGATACILSGYILRFIVPHFGTQNLFLLVVVLLLGFITVINLLSRLEQSTLVSSKPRMPAHTSHIRPAYFTHMLNSKQIQSLTLMVIAATIAVILTDFQFKAASRIHFQGSELAGFFGTFYGTGNMAALLVQIFLVYRIFHSGGLLVALRILPSGLFFTSVMIVITNSFAWIVASRFLIQVLAFTIELTAIQLLYLGVNKQSRSQTRAFVDGVVKPAAIAISGLLLIGAIKIIPLHWLTGVSAAAALSWILLTRKNHTAYISSLVDSLNARRIDLSSETSTLFDKTFVEQLRIILLTTPDKDLPYIVNLTSELHNVDWSPEYQNLLHRDSAASKITAIQYFKEKGKTKYLAEILKYIQHPDTHVRAEVIKAASIMGSQKVLQSIEQYLADSDLSIREAVVVGLLNHGKNNSRLNAQAVLTSLIDTEAPELRCAAARILSHIKHHNLIQWLLKLLSDPDHSVIIEAIRTCRYHHEVTFIPVLAGFLDNPKLRSEAIETLVQYGPKAVDHLISLFGLNLNPPLPLGIYQISGILTRIGNPKAIPVLLNLFSNSDQELRSAAIEGFCTLISKRGIIKHHLPAIKNALQREIEENSKLLESLWLVQHIPHNEILFQALKEEYNHHIKNIFNLLDLQYTGANIRALYDILTGSNLEKRANALEILDNVLIGKNRSIIMQMLEPEKKEMPTLSPCDIIHYIYGLESINSEWVIAGSLYAIGMNKLQSCVRLVIDGLKHHNYVMRETALFALKEIDVHDEGIIDIIGYLHEDPHPVVRKQAQEFFNSQNIC